MIRNSLVGILAASTIAFAAADKGGSPAVPPAPPATPATKTEVKVLGIRTDVEKPANAKRAGAKSKYDFDGLEVGQSFGVIGKDAKSFNSIIYSAEQRHAIDVIDPATNQPKTRVKKLKGGATEVVNQKQKTREFSAYDVDPKTDPDGATVRVFRDK